MRDTSVAGTATTISNINVGDFFTLFETNVGIGQTVSTYDGSGNVIGISTFNLDTIFQADTVSNETLTITGIGTTVVRRVMAKISGIATVNWDSTTGDDRFDSTGYTFDNTAETLSFSGIMTTSTFLGNYSWGRIDLHSRSQDNTFNGYGHDGFAGIKTSAIVQRTNRLRFQNYT